MWVTVYYGDEFCSIGSDQFVPLEAKLCDLLDYFPEAIRVTISGDDFQGE